MTQNRLCLSQKSPLSVPKFILIWPIISTSPVPKSHLELFHNLPCCDPTSTSPVPKSHLVLSHNSSHNEPISTSPVPTSCVVLSHNLSHYDSISISPVPKSHLVCPIICLVNSLTTIRFRQEQITPPPRFPTVGIVQKVPSTTNTRIHKHHHHGEAVHPSYDVGLMNLPNLMAVTSLEGVGQECFAWV